MINELKFVKGSVSTKELIPSLTHFMIENGTIRGFNGVIALGAPINCDLNCKPKAGPLIKAIENCNDVIQLSLTASGRLSIKSDKFKALIDCIDEETPHVIPEGEEFNISGSLLIESLKVISDFIGTDASRPWCEGILLQDQSAFATNNIILVEKWLGFTIPFPINIPKVAIKEILRIKEIPEKALIKDNCLSLIYPEGKWLRTQLLDTKWPDVKSLLDRSSTSDNSTLIEFDKEIFKGLDVITPFVDDSSRVYIADGYLQTKQDFDQSTTYQIENKSIVGIYNIEMMKILKNVVKTIDWTPFPKPCPFFGENLRGIIIGMRE